MNSDNPACCHVCLHLYSRFHHCPKILPCGHTACDICLKEWTTRRNSPLVQCPHCRKQFPDLRTVDDAPINFGLIEMINFLAKSKGKDCGDVGKDEGESSNINNAAKKCEIDSLCPNPASHQCMQCPQGNQLMCKDHLSLHSLFKSLKTHYPIPTDQFPSSSSSPHFCKEHVGMPLVIFCWDCAKLICDRCNMFGHKTHSCLGLEPAVDKIKTDLQSQLDSINEMVDKWKLLDGDVTSSVERMREREEKLLTMTDRMWDELQQAVENGRVSMKKQVVDIMQLRYNSETKMLEEVKQKMNEAAEIIERGQAAIAEKDCATAASGGCETTRQAKEFHDQQSISVSLIEREREMVEERKKEEARELRLDSAMLNEAKMMMEEGMRGVMIALWGGFTTDNGNGSNEANESELEKKRKVIRGLVERGLPLGYINCSGPVYGVAWSVDGNSVYVTAGSGGICEIDINNGRIIKTIGTEEVPLPQFLAVSKTGDLYVCSPTTQKVYVLSSSTGQIIRQIGSTQGAADGQFDNTYSLCIADECNEVYVADKNNDRVQVFSMVDGRFLRKFGQLRNPVAVAVDAAAGLIFISECGNDRIQVFNRHGESIRTFGSYGAANGQLNGPHGIVVDPTSRQLIVCDLGNHRSCIFDYDGSFVGIISSPLMMAPWFISINKDRRLVVSGHNLSIILFFDLPIK